jgi:hypothetical protein
VTSVLSSVKEWLSPASVVHRSVPPMDAGLRPNNVLDEATTLTAPGEHEPDDVVLVSSRELWFSSGSAVWSLQDQRASLVAELGGLVGPLARRGTEVLAAVEGRGVVNVVFGAPARDVCTGEHVRSCVTDLAVLPDGALLVTVGSRRVGADGWARALVDDDRTGALVRVDGDRARVLTDELAWPSGVSTAGGEDILLSLSLAMRVERRPLGEPGTPGRPVLTNLPAYPGRIRAGRAGWWVAAPYVRNRGTELILDEPELRSELIANIKPTQWPLPRLRTENPYTEPLQLGQLRVLGVLKPWAPPRSYGLVFLLGREGRIVRSFHSRVDGNRHGITGVAEDGDRLVVASLGGRVLLEMQGE